MTTTSSLAFPSNRRNRTITHCKVKKRNHLSGKGFAPDLNRHERFHFQPSDLYDYDDGYAFLCAKGDSPDGDMGSPMTLPSRWSKSSPRASVDDIKRFKRNLNVNSNIFEEYAKVEKDWVSGPPTTSSHYKYETRYSQDLQSSDVEDDFRIELQAKVHDSGRLEKVERAVDYCTCMLCVRGIFYNFVDDEDDCNSSQSPCSCSEPGVSCTKRWSILTMLACFMPCLIFYPPIRGCLTLCKKHRNKQRAKDGDVTVRMLKSKRGSQKETDV